MKVAKPANQGGVNESLWEVKMRRHLMSAAAAVAVIASAPAAWADMAAAEKWIDEEFQPSVLSREEQKAEMEWFIKAAEPYAGMEINVLSEGIPTHQYEADVLTKAFEEITGIKVNHQILGEGEVVQAVQTQMQTNRNLGMATLNDSLLDWVRKDAVTPEEAYRKAVDRAEFAKLLQAKNIPLQVDPE